MGDMGKSYNCLSFLCGGFEGNVQGANVLAGLSGIVVQRISVQVFGQIVRQRRSAYKKAIYWVSSFF